MEVKQVLEKIQQQYKDWKLGRDRENIETDWARVADLLGSFMYRYATYYKDDVYTLQTFVNGLYELEDIFVREVSLNTYKRVYENVRTLKEPHRTSRLSALMTDMERTYKIPMLNNEQFNSDNVEVVKLYREISAARDL